jgi:filamentous hemagglutinin
VKPVSGAVAVGATVIGVGADAVEQLVRPDMGQTGVNAAGSAVSEIVNKRVPVLAPITNEIVEAAKASEVGKSIQEKLNAGTDLGK